MPILYQFTDAAEFLSEIEREVGQREVEHHLLLGVARAAAERPKPGAVLVTLRDGAGLALAAFMTPPRPLLLATDRSDSTAAVSALARWLAERGHAPTGLIADVPVAEHFVSEWNGTTGTGTKLKMRQRLFALREVAPVRTSPGALRQATADDLEVVARWSRDFHSEAIGGSLDPELREAVPKRVELGEIYLWEDGGEPSTMAASARPTARGIAINSVYTPPELRRRGYATTCVAALSRRLLDEGREFCVLYTDLANPTSNAIYQRIGYKPVSDSVFYEFKS